MQLKKLFKLYIMKSILFFGMLFITTSIYSQQYTTPPGLDKFVGTWQYINATDTITFKSSARYAGGGDIFLKGLYFYYNYKSGSNIIYSNLVNFSINKKGDFVGTKPYGGTGLDTLVLKGMDKLKRRRDEGYLIINSTGTQLTFIREIGISGGGLYGNEPGQGPLPGFTLPSPIIFTKVVIPSN